MTNRPIVVITGRNGLVQDVHANVPVSAFVKDLDCPPDQPLVIDFGTEPLLPEQERRILARQEHQTTNLKENLS